MNDEELAARYRNLLIVLAKEIRTLHEHAQKIRYEASNEANVGRKCGMNSKANSRDQHKARLIEILGRNSAACNRFFGTAAWEKIATQEIVLHHQASRRNT